MGYKCRITKEIKTRIINIVITDVLYDRIKRCQKGDETLNYLFYFRDTVFISGKRLTAEQII